MSMKHSVEIQELREGLASVKERVRKLEIESDNPPKAEEPKPAKVKVK